MAKLVLFLLLALLRMRSLLLWKSPTKVLAVPLKPKLTLGSPNEVASKDYPILPVLKKSNHMLEFGRLLTYATSPMQARGVLIDLLSLAWKCRQPLRVLRRENSLVDLNPTRCSPLAVSGCVWLGRFQLEQHRMQESQVDRSSSPQSGPKGKLPQRPLAWDPQPTNTCRNQRHDRKCSSFTSQLCN